ncbi:MAG: hypothetical protein RMH75_03370 [Archaeoglobaceae archaeon]|nr:hypothetical protein [Archaeoglobaceae archaeon]MDW7989696.1 hypothetical protein [Archaeoglobaceae archaeon]
MVRRLERRSARILAIILAFIMLGSIFAYISGGGGVEKRETKMSFSMLEIAAYVPENAIFFYYNLTEYGAILKKLGKNDPLVRYVEGYIDEELNYAFTYYLNRRTVEFTRNIEDLLVVQIGDFHVYFINEKSSKVYFAKQSEQNIGNLSVKISGVIALSEDIHPLVIGYAPLVFEIVKNIDENRTENYEAYLSKFNETMIFSFFTFGNKTGKYLRFTQAEESPVDFFFQAFRYNDTSKRYEKVWGIHFTENYFFYDLNETERDFEYYHFINFEDGFSIAVMGDRNFSKVLNANPNVIGFIMTETNES